MSLGMDLNRATLLVEPLQIRRPDLIAQHPWATVERFFTRDRSSAGPRSSDAYAGGSPPSRVIEAGVSAINVTMGARSPHSDWNTIIKRGDIPHLKALGKAL